MSAWIPAKEHIDAMVRIIADTDIYRTWADDLSRGEYGGEINGRPDSLFQHHAFEAKNIIGQELTREVILSVSDRYPRDGMLELPGARPAWWGEPYEYEETTRVPTYAESLKIFDCYDYQACEHETYSDSFVAKLVTLIRDDLENYKNVDAYNDAPWGWTSAQSTKEVRA